MSSKTYRAREKVELNLIDINVYEDSYGGVNVYAVPGKDYAKHFGTKFLSTYQAGSAPTTMIDHEWKKGNSPLAWISIAKESSSLSDFIGVTDYSTEAVEEMNDQIEQIKKLGQTADEMYQSGASEAEIDSVNDELFEILEAITWPVKEDLKVDWRLAWFYVFPRKSKFSDLMSSEERNFYRGLGAGLLCWVLKTMPKFNSNDLVLLEADASEEGRLARYYNKLGFHYCVNQKAYEEMAERQGACFYAKVSDLRETCDKHARKFITEFHL